MATLTELIDEVREGLVCDRCGRYVGSLAARRYRPAPYPVGLGPIGPDEEPQALLGFERYLVGLIREDAFIARHPEIDGRCVSLAEWLAQDDEEADAEPE